MNSFHRGFTIIESICMLGAIVVFTLICLAIYKKQPEFFGLEPAKSKATSQVILDQGASVKALF